MFYIFAHDYNVNLNFIISILIFINVFMDYNIWDLQNVILKSVFVLIIFINVRIYLFASITFITVL